jgi:hypothetical protein
VGEERDVLIYLYFSNCKTKRLDISEILLKVALNTITPKPLDVSQPQAINQKVHSYNLPLIQNTDTCDRTTHERYGGLG